MFDIVCVFFSFESLVLALVQLTFVSYYYIFLSPYSRFVVVAIFIVLVFIHFLILLNWIKQIFLILSIHIHYSAESIGREAHFAFMLPLPLLVLLFVQLLLVVFSRNVPVFSRIFGMESQAFVPDCLLQGFFCSHVFVELPVELGLAAYQIVLVLYFCKLLVL